jgi:aconitate hydratase 2/2-methylisocitrate dehydratase
MGNQARVPDGARVFSTSTRNFDNRMGDDAQVYLGSAELAAMVAILGRIPTVEEYFRLFEEKIAPGAGEIYRGLRFDEMEGF